MQVNLNFANIKNEEKNVESMLLDSMVNQLRYMLLMVKVNLNFFDYHLSSRSS